MKTKQLHLRVSPEEVERFKSNAEAVGGHSEVIRKLITAFNEQMEEEGRLVWPPKLVGPGVEAPRVRTA